MTYENYMRNRQNRLRNMNGCNCDSPPQAGAACCDGSHLRDEGIKRRSPGVYFADADLQCATIFCSGSDNDIEYEWFFELLSGDARALPPLQKRGNNTLTVVGSGRFALRVRVTFVCSVIGALRARCVREATVIFEQ